ncbi:VanW family protein [Kallotenue papyrolyticum]|uniref:VanW family protein n=1 Tax=Kallotenue papyrolyticum TaxID=1325125 RepID=UPI0004922638|nr:VanW family protein [Kallotenue papyrolyticum]
MPQRNFPEYGPIQRRRGAVPPRPMAMPMRDEAYTGATIPMRAPRRQVAAPMARRRGGSGWWWKGALLLLVLLFGAAVAGLAWLDRQYANRIYPNITVQGVDLSRMTVDQAQRALEQKYAAFLERPITIVYQGRAWEPSAAELGIRVDLRRMVAEAYNAGRGPDLVNNLRQIAVISQRGLDLPLRLEVDGVALQRYLQRIAAEVEQPGREASLTIVDAQPRVSESVNGRIVLLDETASDVLRALQRLEPQTVTLRTAEIEPQLTSERIAEAQRTVEAMLAAPLRLTFKDTVYELDQPTIADMITFQRVPGDKGVVLNAQLDQAKLEKWVTRLANKIGRASVEPRVNWNGGNLQIFQPGRVGYRLDIPRTIEMINGAIATVTRELELPVDEVQPRVTPENLHTLGIRELVSVGKSDFTGSAPYRITNIKVGVQKLHGILIAPGEEFSFNENVGNIDAANGFVEGYAIVGNRTQLEPGGGICQDSTTLFRAAFYAGLPFTAWTPHRFRISWYEKYDTIGMDATIFTGGGPDLRFVNDTGNWLLIQGYVNDADATVTFALYGTKVPGRVVERTAPKITNETPAPTKPVYIDDPEIPVGQFKQTDMARGGMEIEIWRIVKQDGQVVRRELFRTKFEAWPNIYLKNPKTPVPPGT